MRARRLSQADVSSTLGCDSGVLNRWLWGLRVPSLQYLLAIESKFGIPLRLWHAKSRRRAADIEQTLISWSRAA